MPTQDYIEDHELFDAYWAVQEDKVTRAHLRTFAHYDIDPLTEDFAEILEAITEQAASNHFDNQRKLEREVV